jgi:septum formation topological specificity factor MinE
MSSTIDKKNHLTELQAERALAQCEGLSAGSAYIEDLDEEIAEVIQAYVSAAVTEIALLRAELSSPLFG